jgi:hypothetical protein
MMTNGGARMQAEMQEAVERRYKWFWAWQDEKEEEWLRSMAQQGYHLVSLSPGIYTFERGEPRDDVYRLDFITSDTDKEEYLQLFADAGWEHVGVLSGWQYFRRTAAAGEPDEIYTDTESKAQKYHRLIGFLVIFTPIYTVTFITLITRVDRSPYVLLPLILMAVISVLWGIALLMIARRIKQLERLRTKH